MADHAFEAYDANPDICRHCGGIRNLGGCVDISRPQTEAPALGLKSSLAESLTIHSPNQEQIDRIEDVRRGADQFATLIDVHIPDSREKSLAKTKLEECVMWAVKGLILPSNQGPKEPKND